MDDSPRPRITWITNVAAPYRRPVWAALAQLCALDLVLLEPNESLRRDGRRGEDWESPTGSSRHPRVVRIARGERVFYALLSTLGLRRRRVGSVLIGGWESPAYWQALAEARLTGTRCVGFYESPAATNLFSRGPIAWARRWFFRRLDGVVVPGAAARDAVLSFGVAADKIFEGFNAVDVERFHEESGKRTESEGHRFVYVGQMIERKNVVALVEAFARVRQRHDTLTLIGDGSDLPTVVDRIAALELTEVVRTPGPIANDALARELAHHDTLALVSHDEVWGLVVNEALAARLQVVVSREAGVTASIRGMSGVFETDTSVAAIAASLARARESWVGPIEDPEIRAHTPERFAEVFARALGLASVNRA